MVTPTVIVGVFLFLSIGFLQVPGTLNGDSSTFCVRFVRLDLQSKRCEYKDLQSAYRITNAYIQCSRITNSAERQEGCL